MKEHSPCLITSSLQFKTQGAHLGRGDVVAVVPALGPADELLMAILAERGVVFFPSISSQLMSRSKALQALVLGHLMVPNTFVIQARRDLIQAMGMLQEAGIGEVITKHDRGDCGIGISLWGSTEELFSHVSWLERVAGPDTGRIYPFVLQPFIKEARDVRVIVIGDYVEAYERSSAFSFRNNMHFGGQSRPFSLGPGHEALCRKAMEQGCFPYAHIDLLLAPGGECYLSEIALNGGIRGASISARECLSRKEGLRERFLSDLGLVP
jgi:ribosomal protein S6--L-glutamate ligase